MRHLIRILCKANAHISDTTTFCDSCGEVCTLACRHESRLRHDRDSMRRNGFIQF